MIYNKDSAFLGLFLGFIIPVIFYLIQDMIIPFVIGHSFSNQSMQLFALIFNAPLLRYYLINLKHESTGKGILFVTFIYGLIWVYINQGSI
ncbi:MAG: hypothetical protein CMD27_04325 [Flavobacteriales bacterium]|nr:hypothetical protein [Flavobacteriales bacterium]|tara:strand:+ start:1563 stop:1835 length:273 start_codon:yes stop_codon:yes gene_type:complete